MKQYQKPFYYCAPGEKIPVEILEKLKEINNVYSKSKDFPKYMQNLSEFFKLDPIVTTTDSKLFLGGFIEGEASLNVSAKKLKTAHFGLCIDPEFSLTQHINGLNHLFAALSIFQTGRIRYKDGSNATLVFVIDNRTSLEDKVIPFYEKYVAPYASPVKMERLKIFKELILIFKEKGHLDLETFLNKVLPLWDSLRMQKGQINESFASLEEAQEFVRRGCRAVI
jgi:hypothetical protein